MPSRSMLPRSPFSADVTVRAPGNETFGDYVGIIQPVRMSANYRRVVFPGHPWQRDAVGWAFHIDELEIVEQGHDVPHS